MWDGVMGGGARRRAERARVLVASGAQDDLEANLRWSEVTPWKLLAADGVATSVERLLTYPLDLLRTRVQMDVSSKHLGLMPHMWHVTCSTWLEGWHLGLGAAYNKQAVARQSLASLVPLPSSAAAAAARASAATPTGPVFGRVGVRLASAAAAMARGVKAMSPRPLVQQVEQARVYFSGMRHGVKGMYRGFGYSTALQMPSNMIYLSSYLVITEALQAQLERCCTNSAAARCRLEGLAPLIPVTAAMCSETLVSLLEVPHDVITQKLQVQHAARSQGFQRSWRTPSRGVDAVRKVVAVHGWKSLYVGTRAHLLTSVPWSATWWGTYEGGKFALHGLCSLMNAHSSDGTRAAICCRELSAHIATMTPVLAGMTAGVM